jgi:uncharacterized iron-regulated membrane protein
MRAALTYLHRYAGLLIAAFLFLSGATGAIISWDHELDDLLNPHLMQATAPGAPLSPLTLADDLARDHPQARVTFVPLETEAGKSYRFGVEPRVDPKTGALYPLGYNEVFLDPATGQELGRREWGAAWPVTGENVVSFLYVLHYSLHMPTLWGIDRWGIWLMGVIAAIWTLDCFVGFALTLPAKANNGTAARGWWARWKPAWKIKYPASGYRINFDIHRAFGLWVWALLFILAFTAFSLNLYREVFFPAMSTISKVTPTPFDVRAPQALDKPIEAKITYPAVLNLARREGQRRGWTAPPGSIFYSSPWGIYGVSFFEPGGDHGAAGVGPPILYYDGVNGKLLGDRQPWKGTAADLFVQAQFPLHSGRILGLPGRILISAMGLVVAILSVTGVVIWARKRRARLARARIQNSGGGGAATPSLGSSTPAIQTMPLSRKRR